MRSSTAISTCGQAFRLNGAETRSERVRCSKVKKGSLPNRMVEWKLSPCALRTFSTVNHHPSHYLHVDKVMPAPAPTSSCCRRPRELKRLRNRRRQILRNSTKGRKSEWSIIVQKEAIVWVTPQVSVTASIKHAQLVAANVYFLCGAAIPPCTRHAIIDG